MTVSSSKMSAAAVDDDDDGDVSRNHVCLARECACLYAAMSLTRSVHLLLLPIASFVGSIDDDFSHCINYNALINKLLIRCGGSGGSPSEIKRVKMLIVQL